MARLPTDMDLGAAPAADPTQPVANYQAAASVVGTGAEKLGQGVDQLGKGLGDLAENQKLFQYHMASSTLNANLINLNEQTKNDTTPGPDASGKSLVNRHAEQAWQLQDQAASSVPDGPMRQMFMATSGQEVQRSISAADDHARVLTNSQSKANWWNQDIIDSAVKAPDDATRTKIFDSQNASLEQMKQLGLISPMEAHDMGQAWAKQYSITKAQAAANSGDPAQMQAAIDELRSNNGGGAAGLQYRESGNNPTLVNKLGYAGLMQYGAPRLADIGVYTPGQGENLDTWSKTSKSAPGKWSGTFNIPGHPEVQTLHDFLNNPAAQDVVHGIDQNHMDQEIASRGLDKYVGQTVGGVQVTQQSLYNMIHLGGAAGASAALNSGFENNPRDANGTTLRDYAQMGSTGGNSGSHYDVLSPPEREQLIGHLQTQLSAHQEDSAKAIQLQKVQTQAASDQAEMKIRQTVYSSNGDPSSMPTNTQIVNTPGLTRESQDRLIKFVHAAGGDNKDRKDYGPGWLPLFNQATAKQGDPQRLSDPSQLYGHVSNGDITVSGMKMLETLMTGRKTAEGETAATGLALFKKNAEHQLVHSTPYFKDPKGEQLTTDFMMSALPAYYDGIAHNKTPAQLLTSTSPDFIGKNLESFKRTPNEISGDLYSANKDQMAEPKPAAKQIDTTNPQAVIEAVLTGKMTRADADVIALKNKWAGPNRPAAPAAPAGPQVPISQ